MVVKVEPLRWYHHCDRLGMLVWQDLPNGGERYLPNEMPERDTDAFREAMDALGPAGRGSKQNSNTFGHQDAQEAGRAHVGHGTQFADGLQLLLGLHREGTAVVVITHDRELASRFDRQAVMRDGQLVDDRRRGALAAAPGHPARPPPRAGR